MCSECDADNRKTKYGGIYSTERQWKCTGIIDRNTGDFADRHTFQRLLTEQGGHCGLCSQTEDLVLDHDHSTGYARGVLCHNHNRALGYLGDYKEGLLKALTYIGRVDIQDQITTIHRWRNKAA